MRSLETGWTEAEKTGAAGRAAIGAEDSAAVDAGEERLAIAVLTAVGRIQRNSVVATLQWARWRRRARRLCRRLGSGH